MEFCLFRIKPSGWLCVDGLAKGNDNFEQTLTMELCLFRIKPLSRLCADGLAEDDGNSSTLAMELLTYNSCAWLWNPLRSYENNLNQWELLVFYRWLNARWQ